MFTKRNEKIKYLFLYRGLNVGGAEMLMKNIAEEWLKSGYDVEILCEAADPVMLAQMEEKQIPVKQGVAWTALEKTLREISGQVEELRIITFFWTDFSEVYHLNLKNVKPFFYVVHAYALAVGRHQGAAVRNFLRKIARKKVVRLLRSRNIVCMDELTVDYTMQYYPLPPEARDAFDIVRIPEEIHPIDEGQWKKRAGNTHCNILAIARADFPFKGYMLGLIRYFAQYSGEGDLSLTIISYGKDEEQLRQEYLRVPEEKRQRIRLVGKTSYDELAAYFDDAKLYVGMGTTLLDASQRGVVSVPVQSYTNELHTEGFFHEDFRNLGTAGKETPFDLLLTQVLNWTEEEYLAASRQARDCVEQHYGKENVARQLKEKLDQAEYTQKSVVIAIIDGMFRIKHLIRNLLHRS